MRFRKSVKRERRDRMQNFLDHLRRDLIARHRLTQFHAYLVHSLFRTMKTESTPQFLCFVAGKIRHDHRDLEHLFLKQRHPQGALQHWLQSFVEISDLFFSGTPRQIGMHHIALNWPWADDRDFNHHIVKTFRLQSRQRRHLSPTFDLENSDGVSRLHHLESFGVVLRNVSQIEWAATFTTKLKRILHYRHHAEPKQIDFHNAEVFAIILVPLRHHPPRHRRIFQWHK